MLDGSTVVEGDGWRLELGGEPVDTGEPNRSCLQLVVDDRPLGCIRVGAEAGREYGFGATTRVGDERVIWQGRTMTTDGPSVDHFVVWSSASPSGRRVDAVRYADVENLIWVMQPGEAPWGYQSVGPDGTLVDHWSYVGFPAD